MPCVSCTPGIDAAAFSQSCSAPLERRPVRGKPGIEPVAHAVAEPLVEERQGQLGPVARRLVGEAAIESLSSTTERSAA